MLKNTLPTSCFLLWEIILPLNQIHLLQSVTVGQTTLCSYPDLTSTNICTSQCTRNYSLFYCWFIWIAAHPSFYPGDFSSPSLAQSFSCCTESRENGNRKLFSGLIVPLGSSLLKAVALSFNDCQTALLPWIRRMIIAITAITSNMWMIPPALYPINPIAHPMIRITAIIYNKFPIGFSILG